MCIETCALWHAALVVPDLLEAASSHKVCRARAEGYTPLMVALHRGRLECAKALLRAGADPNYMNGAGDLTLFWAIDGGVECMKLLAECAPPAQACSVHASRST